MGRIWDGIDDRLAGWLADQPVFFVATAPAGPDGHVNCSPKRNQGEFAVIGERRVGYLDRTGSGVETVAHLRDNARIVVMFCAFDGPPRIVRLHGSGHSAQRGSEEYAALADAFSGAEEVGSRSVVVVDVERVSDSCGYGVPLMSFAGHRDTMERWAERKGPEGIADYWVTTNRESIDGLPGLPVIPSPAGDGG